MLVIRQHRIFRKDIQANRHILYIFGDNLDREGMGGQAKEMRGEPNSFGIATKRSITHSFPDDFFFDSDKDVIPILETEFDRLHSHIVEMMRKDETEYKVIVIPMDGIGTGLSRMPELAPNALKYIEEQFKKLENL